MGQPNHQLWSSLTRFIPRFQWTNYRSVNRSDQQLLISCSLVHFNPVWHETIQLDAAPLNIFTQNLFLFHHPASGPTPATNLVALVMRCWSVNWLNYKIDYVFNKKIQNFNQKILRGSFWPPIPRVSHHHPYRCRQWSCNWRSNQYPNIRFRLKFAFPPLALNNSLLLRVAALVAPAEFLSCNNVWWSTSTSASVAVHVKFV